MLLLKRETKTSGQMISDRMWRWTSHLSGRGGGGGTSSRVPGDDDDDVGVMCQQRQKNTDDSCRKTTAGSRLVGLQRIQNGG